MRILLETPALHQTTGASEIISKESFSNWKFASTVFIFNLNTIQIMQNYNLLHNYLTTHDLHLIYNNFHSSSTECPLLLEVLDSLMGCDLGNISAKAER
jgi:hypothetical protein